MQLKMSLALSQLLSLVVFISIARWYVAPWLRSLDRSSALVALLWPHVFRYVALQAYSAQHAGFPISDQGLTRVVYGDVAGMLIAFAAIVALRHRSRIGTALVWLLVAATAFDTVTNIRGGIRENLFGAATNVTWMVVAFYVPLLMVTLGLIVWQLVSRSAEAEDASVSQPPRLLRRTTMAG